MKKKALFIMLVLMCLYSTVYAAGGDEVWGFETDGAVYSSPTVSGDYVYVGSWDSKVYCLNASTGIEVWDSPYDTGSFVTSSPAVTGEYVYVGSYDNKVYCLNAATGVKEWEYPTGAPVRSSPAVTGGYVYVGSDDNNTYCLNASTGAKVWESVTTGAVYSSPAVTGGYVYVGSADGNVYCLDAATGFKAWDDPYTTGGAVYSSPSVSGGYVYVGSSDNNVYCLNSATGTKVWEYATTGVVSSSPSVIGDYVYVGSWDNKVYCLNASTGTKVWEYETGDAVTSSPAVTGGYVYVGSYDENIYCLNAATGVKKWEYATWGPVTSSPSVTGGYVYAGSWDDYVYCLNAATGDSGSWPIFKGNSSRTGAVAISGTVSGDVQKGVSISLYKNICGDVVLQTTVTTGSSGIFSFTGDLYGNYIIIAEKTAYTFSPERRSVTIDDNDESGVDFTSNFVRFVDNGDGTVTDSLTNLIWLKNANCFGIQSQDNAVSYTEGLEDGDCGLSDGSSSGDWILPTKDLFQGIGTNSSDTWYDHFPLGTWTVPSEFFTNLVTASFYWSSTEYSADAGWSISMLDGYTNVHPNSLEWPVWPVKRFVDNGDGTVTDVLTNLIWLKNADCFGSQSHDNAVFSVEGLEDGDCGLSDGSLAGDWRLPSKHQLQGIGTEPPTTWYDLFPSATWKIPSSLFRNLNLAGFYWSSTDYDAEADWSISMLDGYTNVHSETLEWAVWPFKRFIDNSNGTVTDTLTSLTWLKDADCFGSQDRSTASTFTAELEDGDCGLSDGSSAGNWRLPSKDELQGIGTYPPSVWDSQFPSITWTIPSLLFRNLNLAGFYWSSSEYNIDDGWSISMLDGYTNVHPDSLEWPVWPVYDDN